jgi:xylulokinase
MSLYVGVDSGTQSVKAIALDLDTGKVVAEARAPHHLIEGLPPGHMEQHPQEWVSAMDAAIGEVASRIDRSRVRGIGVSGQQHGFVPLDEKGVVIRPAKLWCDTSTSPECAILTGKLGGAKASSARRAFPSCRATLPRRSSGSKRHEPRTSRGCATSSCRTTT